MLGHLRWPPGSWAGPHLRSIKHVLVITIFIDAKLPAYSYPTSPLPRSIRRLMVEALAVLGGHKQVDPVKHCIDEGSDEIHE